MSLWLGALLFMKLQFPLVACWVGCLLLTLLFGGLLQNCFVLSGERHLKEFIPLKLLF